MDRFIAILREEIDLSVKEIEQLAANSCNHAFALSEIYADALNKLKEYILSYSFRNEQEEIRFFKEIKPWFLSRQMFHRKMYYLEVGRPVGNKEEQSAYIEREMSILREYAVRYSDFRCYYRSGDTCLDGVYFTRGRRHDVGYSTEFFEMERDPEFSTLCDFKVALFLAGEMLLAHLERKTAAQNLEDNDSDDPLRWTGTKAGLIEMIYCWVELGTFNNGELSMAKLQKHIERDFGIRMGNISRIFNEMKTRNKATKFLDEMKEALLHRMEREDTDDKKKR